MHVTFFATKIPALHSNMPREAGCVTAQKIYMSMNMNMRNRACSSGKQRKQEKKKKRAGAQDGSPPTQETQQIAGRRAVTAQPGGDERRAGARGAHAPEARAGTRAGTRAATRAVRRSRYGHQGASKRHGSAASRAPRASSASGMARPAANARKRCKYCRADSGRRHRPRRRTSSSGAPMLRR